MEEKALTTAKQPSALDVYGTRDDIKSMAQRIRACLPGGNKLQEHDALALAQLSIAYGLNPFNGEVWIIVDKNGVSRGTMVGIKGLRKAARLQANYWPTFDVLGKAQKQELGIPENAIAYRCNIYRTDLLRQAAEAIDLMRSAGMINAFEVYAYKPAEGIGYCSPGESTKMKPDQAARKRAEAEALKVAFDLPFASETGINGDRVGYVDAEWSDVTDRHSGPEYPQDMPEDEPVAMFSDIPPEEPSVQAPPQPAEKPPAVDLPANLPHEPTAFLGAVNQATGFHYKNLYHLLNALGTNAWPARNDTAGWEDYYRRAVKHAETKHGEPPVEQPEMPL